MDGSWVDTVLRYFEHVTSIYIIQVFIHFWHAPFGVCSTKWRHQSPEWMILSHVNCFIQGEVWISST